jgi:D-glycero-alpha-D-manno-heptose-7-phosphate kinase
LNEISYDGNFDIFKAAVRVMKPDFGFELWVHSDYPSGSGLGGSATVLSAVIGCLNVFRSDPLDNYHIAEHAFEAERIELSISGGWQDQYSTVFGGFNFMEFSKNQNIVTPLRIGDITLNELEERFLLCFTGSTHLGETIQAGNRERAPDDPSVVSFANDIKDIAMEMKSHLTRGSLGEFGRMLDATWRLKKQFNPLVTSEEIDLIYDTAINSGAEGGRLLGTGGGGYFLFFVKPFERNRVASALRSLGLSTDSLIFDNQGLQSWAAR